MSVHSSGSQKYSEVSWGAGQPAWVMGVEPTVRVTSQISQSPSQTAASQPCRRTISSSSSHQPWLLPCLRKVISVSRPVFSLISTLSGLESVESAQPVILLQPTSFENVFAGFPDFGQFERFPSFSGFDNIDIPHPPQIELKDIFGSNKEQPLNPAGDDCGLICKVDYI